MKIDTSKIFQIKTKEDFKKISIQLFELHMKHNSIYSSYVRKVSSINNPTRIEDIPFLPIRFFKSHNIIHKKMPVEKIFVSSGTTNKKSKHFISDLSIYRKSFINSFKKFYGDISGYCILALLPSYTENENSSLIYMMNDLIKKSNNKKSGFYMSNFESLCKNITELESRKQKTILFGVSYALLDFAKKYPMPLRNTIIIETGGMKGRKKEITKLELHEKLRNAFSLKRIHSEYGMTETLSQAYSKGDNLFQCPP